MAISITSFSIMANSFQANIEIESICTTSFIVKIACHDGVQYLEFNWIATIPHKSGIFIYTHHIDFSAFDEANTVQGYRILRKKAVHDTGIINPGTAIGLSGFGFYNAQKVGPRFGVDIDSVHTNGYRMNFKLWDNVRLKFAKVFVLHYERRSTTHDSLISGSIGSQVGLFKARCQNPNLFNGPWDLNDPSQTLSRLETHIYDKKLAGQ
jgi:hypothetical protein